MTHSFDFQPSKLNPLQVLAVMKKYQLDMQTSERDGNMEWIQSDV